MEMQPSEKESSGHSGKGKTFPAHKESEFILTPTSLAKQEKKMGNRLHNISTKTTIATVNRAEQGQV